MNDRAEKFDGTYVTKRDPGVEYSFECTWKQAESALVWWARVTRESKLVANPHGTFVLAGHFMDLPRMVKTMVETAIERQDGLV